MAPKSDRKLNRHTFRLHDINLSGLEFTVKQENEGGK